MGNLRYERRRAIYPLRPSDPEKGRTASQSFCEQAESAYSKRFSRHPTTAPTLEEADEVTFFRGLELFILVLRKWSDIIGMDIWLGNSDLSL
jgi:hypothetical protein